MANLYTIPNMTSGMDEALVGISREIPVFTPAFLIFVWGVIWLGGIFAQKRRLGVADVPMWTVIASLGTLMVALPLTIIAGLIDGTTLGILVTITIMSGFWLFWNRNRNEV